MRLRRLPLSFNFRDLAVNGLISCLLTSLFYMKRIRRGFSNLNRSLDTVFLFWFGASETKLSGEPRKMSENEHKRKSDKMDDQNVEAPAPAEKKNKGEKSSQSTPSRPLSAAANPSSSGGGASALPNSEDSAFVAPPTEDFITLCDEMNKELSLKAGVDENSYAGKIRAPQKVYPYALFILAADATRENLEKAHFNGFQDYVFQARVKLAHEENQKLVIDWMNHYNSYGVAACATKDTALWLKAQAAVFKYKEKSTRCVFHWERQSATLYSVFLQGAMWKQKNMKPNWVLAKILEANNLRGEFRGVSYDTKRNSRGVFMEFEPISEELKSGLDQKSWLNCFTCNPVLRKRVRKERSEEEFLTFLSKRDPAVLGKKPMAS